MRYIFFLFLPLFLMAHDHRFFDFILDDQTVVLILAIFLIGFVLRHFELKKVNQQLIGSIKDIESLINSTVEGIIISKDFKCLDMNDSAMELLQVKNKEQIKGVNPLSFVDEDSKEKVLDHIKKADGELFEINIKKMDGSTSPALVKWKNINFLNKKIRVSLIIDMSEIKQKELKFLQQSKLAALGEMIANIAHQWRQPLSVISTGATGMKLQKELGVLDDDQFFSHCDKINENAQYLSQTIDDFRNFITGDSQPVKFNLKNDTDSFIKLVDGTIKRYNIEVILELQENIKVQGYPNELIQCFINIFNNAKDALVENTPEDERYIFISEYNTDDQAMIIFKDNGGGIDEEIISKIFDPYFTTKDQSQGTGLGLHMSYNLIVNGMGGDMSVSNEEYTFNGKKYKGAEFKITIPIESNSKL